ncbi:MAG: hypothetical protein ACTSVI_09615 [Promethearchaeota archaeon]
MKDKHLTIKLENNNDMNNLQNPYLKIIHPLARSAPGKKPRIITIPTGIDGLINKVAAKTTLLELMK